MDPSTNFAFEDFTLDNYRQLLRLAKAHYTVTRYPECRERTGFVLWRHDVDFDLFNCTRLSDIEKEEGVTATYFLRLNSETYNLFSAESRGVVQHILRNGHSIGLHFEFECHDIHDEAGLARALTQERQIVENLCGCEVGAFSYHNPSENALSYRNWSYAGMINTYAAYFRDEVAYCSDSNGYWRHVPLRQALEAGDGHRSLQVLTHPVWWRQEVLSPYQRVQQTLEEAQARFLTWYDATLTVWGRHNVR